ncbi:MAG: PH domain-containing protein [Nitrospirales bacterium]
MEPIVVKPEKDQKTLWLIIWGILFVPGLVAGVVLTIVLHYPGNLILGISSAGWLILMIPIWVWIPAFYRSLEYVIASDSIRANKGVFWKRRVTVPYEKITNLDVTQGPVQRMFSIGTLHVQTAGAGGTPGARAELRLLGVRDLDRLKDTIMEKVRGSSPAGGDELKGKVVGETDSEIFRRMLEELRAIRDALEKKQG